MKQRTMVVWCVLAAGLCAPVGAQTAPAPLPAPPTSPVSSAPATPADAPAWPKQWDDYFEVLERAQSEEGRKAGASNGYTHLIEILELIQRADKQTWLDEQGQLRPGEAAPDYGLLQEVIAGREKESDENRGSLERTRRHLALLVAGGIDAKLDAIAKAPRMMRMRPGTEEFRKHLRATRINDQQVSAVHELMIDVQMPELGYLRQLTRMNGARMHAAALEGDWSAVCKHAEQTTALGRLASFGGTLISTMVSAAIDSAAATSMLDAISDARVTGKPKGGPDAEVLDCMVLAIGAQRAHHAGIKLALKTERMFASQLVGVAFTQAGPTAKGKLQLNKLGLQLREEQMQSLTLASQQRELDAMYTDMIEIVALPFAEMQPRLAALKLPDDASPVIGIMMPPLERMMGGQLQTAAKLVAARTVLALKAMQAGGRALPEKLGDVAEIAAAATDPYSGKPMLYRRSADGAEFELWVTGYDGQDDGAAKDSGIAQDGLRKLVPGTDVRLWPRESK